MIGIDTICIIKIVHARLKTNQSCPTANTQMSGILRKFKLFRCSSPFPVIGRKQCRNTPQNAHFGRAMNIKTLVSTAIVVWSIEIIATLYVYVFIGAGVSVFM